MGLVLLYRRGLYIYALELCYCKNVMSRRIVMTTHGVMCDVRHPRQEEALGKDVTRITSPRTVCAIHTVMLVIEVTRITSPRTVCAIHTVIWVKT